MKRKTRTPTKHRRAAPTELSPAMGALVAQEDLILAVATRFSSMLDELQTTRTQYAKLIRVPESHVKRLMEGRNMTLGRWLLSFTPPDIGRR